MALQTPITKTIRQVSVLAPTGNNVGLRRPADNFGLKSSFFPLSLIHLFDAANQHSAPKFSIHVAASKQAYICCDCRYIYSDRTPLDKKPVSYFCPVCGAPKRRFKVCAPEVSKNANEKDVRKASRKAQVQRDEAVGKALPIGIVIGIVALVALFLYLNSTLV